MVEIIEFTGENLADIYDIAPSRDIYFTFDHPGSTERDREMPWLAHYCTSAFGAEPDPERFRWVWAGTALHTLVSRDPLHLEASIGWMQCCGRHGFIRNGQWEPAGDFGWGA